MGGGRGGCRSKQVRRRNVLKSDMWTRTRFGGESEHGRKALGGGSERKKRESLRNNPRTRIVVRRELGI